METFEKLKNSELFNEYNLGYRLVLGGRKWKI